MNSMQHASQTTEVLKREIPPKNKHKLYVSHRSSHDSTQWGPGSLMDIPGGMGIPISRKRRLKEEPGASFKRRYTGRFTPEPTESKTSSHLQIAIDLLGKFDSTTEKVKVDHLVGASPQSLDAVIYKQKSSTGESKDKENLTNELHKTKDFPYHLETLRQYTGTADAYVWMSETLPLDMKIPTSNRQPNLSVQAFLIGNGLPPIVLTIYDTKTSAADDVEAFTAEFARVLTWRLLDFCHLDFVVLACVLPRDNFNVDSLRDEVTKQVDLSRRYFSGPRQLDERTLTELKNAATAVADATYIPGFLLGDEETEDEDKQEHAWQLLPDKKWRNALSELIETFAPDDSQSCLTYTTDNEVKVKTAVLEAAGRLAFKDEVVIGTPDDKIMQCVDKMKKQTREEFQVELSLTILHPNFNSEDECLSTAKYVFGIDCQSDYFQPVTEEVECWNFVRDAVERGEWQIVDDTVFLVVDDPQRNWYAQQAAENAPQDFVIYLIRNSLDIPNGINSGVISFDIAGTVMNRLTNRGLWKAALELLIYGYCHIREKRVASAVKKASQYADIDVVLPMLAFCSDSILDSVLTQVVKRGLWQAVSLLLHRAVSDENRRWAVEQSCERTDEADEDSLIRGILCYCADDQMDTVFSQLIQKRLWKGVRWLLLPSEDRIARTMYDTHAQRVLGMVEFTFFRGNDSYVSYHVHSLVGGDPLFSSPVTTGPWKAVCRFLSRDVSDTQRRQAVEEVCKHAKEDEVTYFLHPCFCEAQQVDSVLKSVIERGHWRAVSKLLSSDRVDEAQRKWAVEEAMKKAQNDSLLDILPHCAAEQLDSVLTEAIKRGLWRSVGKLLQKPGVDRSQKRRAVEEACKFASDDDLSDIISHCEDDQIDSMETEAISRGLWSAVTKLVGRHGVSDEQRRGMFEEASKRANDNDLKDILSQCLDQLDAVLAIVVRQRQWHTLEKLLRTNQLQESQRTRAVAEACKFADEEEILPIIAYCPEKDVDSMLTITVRRGLWKAVGQLLDNDCVSSSQKKFAVETACAHASDKELESIMFYYVDGQLDLVLTTAVSRGLWCAVVDLLRRTDSTNALHKWAVEETSEHATEGELTKSDLFKVVSGSELFPVMISLVRRDLAHVAGSGLVNRWKTEESALEFKSWKVQSETLHVLFEAVASDETITIISSVVDQVVFGIVKGFAAETKENISETQAYAYTSLKFCESEICSVLKVFLSDISFILGITDGLLETFFLRHINEKQHSSTLSRITLPMLALQSLNGYFRKEAAKKLQHEREDDRRFFWQQVIENDLWDVVKELADHSLYDDQRGWALGQALYDGQWDVMVVLADHGLTDEQLRKVYRQVARHADWDTVRQLFERRVDMRVVCEELMAANPSRERPPSKERIKHFMSLTEDMTDFEEIYRQRSKHYVDKRRCEQLMRLGTDLHKIKATLEDLLLKGKWSAVLNKVIRNATQEEIRMTLEHAMQHDAWHVVMQLVRLGMDTAQRDSLFSEVIRRRQWGVGRALLERGVSVELSRAALPQLMEADQWILVARVMELSLDDRERRRVMQEALDKKEGSVVAHGISVIEGRLSVEEREVMYDQALSQGVWQAVKRLVEEKDSTGMAQRDKALVAAVEHHRWDIVDHCYIHGADINKRDAEGNTYLHEKTRHGDWEKVERLLNHGANPNLPNSKGYTAFDTAVNSLFREDGNKGTWNIIETFVKFHGNISKPDPRGETPLRRLLSCSETVPRQWFFMFTFEFGPTYLGGILDLALTWGGDVDWTENYNGKTALHVLCQAGLWDSMRYIVARGGDPLAVTDDGKTVLMTAVEYRGRPYWYQGQGRRQMLVAECIKMGISTHQPRIADIFGDTLHSLLNKSDPVVLRMLYESGACSHKELHKALVKSSLHKQFFISSFLGLSSGQTRCLSTLHEIASNPRSLKSMCRLVISHHLGVCKPRRRQTKVKQLPLPHCLKDYVIFSDLVGPGYGEHDRVSGFGLGAAAGLRQRLFGDSSIRNEYQPLFW